MKKAKNYILFSLLLLVSIFLSFHRVHAQQYFENPFLLTQTDGLNLKNIWDLAKDNRGFLWIGGTNGLLRYDGQVFKEFRHDPSDSTAILDGIVSAIYYEEEAEKLWLGHWGMLGGISVLDLQTEKVKRYPYDPLNTKKMPAKDFYWIHKDKFGQIWGGARQNGIWI